MLKIGITGGIGTGKSTIARIFEVLGIPVFYADAAAKTVMNEDTELRQGIINTFGAQAYLEDGALNRKFIAHIVFNDNKQLQKLNSLVHPAVFRAFDVWAEAHADAPYLMKEAALLFESGSYKKFDHTILVKSLETLRIQRVMQRDNVPEEQVKLRIQRQLPDEEKEKLADFILINDEQCLLIPQVIALHCIFLEKAGKEA